MKKKLLYVLALLIVLAFAGCQNDAGVSVSDTPKTTEVPEATEAPEVSEPAVTPTPVPVVTRDETPASAFGYEIRDGEVVLGGLRDESWSLSEIVIPEKIEGYPVTSIGNDAFWNWRNLTSIEIPEGVTSIGPEAFYHCRSLKSIIVSQGSYAEQWAKDEGYADMLVLK